MWTGFIRAIAAAVGVPPDFKEYTSITGSNVDLTAEITGYAHNARGIMAVAGDETVVAKTSFGTSRTFTAPKGVLIVAEFSYLTSTTGNVQVYW